MFAIAAAVAVTIARLAAGFPGEESPWLFRNVSLLTLPFLVGYFAWNRRSSQRHWLLAAAPVVVTAVLVNAYPFVDDGSTETIAATHLGVVLWYVVAYAYSGYDVRSHERRMDFVRFTGEFIIYYALIALGARGHRRRRRPSGHDVRRRARGYPASPDRSRPRGCDLRPCCATIGAAARRPTMIVGVIVVLLGKHRAEHSSRRGDPRPGRDVCLVVR